MLRKLLPYLGIATGNPGDNVKAAWSQLILGLLAYMGMGGLFSAIAIINIVWLFSSRNWIAVLFLLIALSFVVHAVRNVFREMAEFKKTVCLPDVPDPMWLPEDCLEWDEEHF